MAGHREKQIVVMLKPFLDRDILEQENRSCLHALRCAYRGTGAQDRDTGSIGTHHHCFYLLKAFTAERARNRKRPEKEWMLVIAGIWRGIGIRMQKRTDQFVQRAAQDLARDRIRVARHTGGCLNQEHAFGHLVENVIEAQATICNGQMRASVSQCSREMKAATYQGIAFPTARRQWRREAGNQHSFQAFPGPERQAQEATRLLIDKRRCKRNQLVLRWVVQVSQKDRFAVL